MKFIIFLYEIVKLYSKYSYEFCVYKYIELKIHFVENQFEI